MTESFPSISTGILFDFLQPSLSSTHARFKPSVIAPVGSYLQSRALECRPSADRWKNNSIAAPTRLLYHHSPSSCSPRWPARWGRHCSQIALYSSTSPSFFLHLRGQSHQRIFLQSYPFNSLRRRVPHGHSRTNVVAPFRDIATDDDDDEAAQSLGGACAGGSNPEERARVSWRRRRRRWRWWGKRFFPDDLPTCAKGDFDLGGCISPTCAKAR